MRYAALMAVSGLMAMALQAPAFGNSPTAREKGEDRLVCKSKAKTGTRFQTKTCRTVREWDQIAEQQKRDAAEMINRPQIKACGPMTGCD